MLVELGLFCACLLAGLVNSVAGGGIMVVFPALLALGIPPIIANATSNLISWPGSLSSAYGYRSHLRRLPPKYLMLLVPCVLGAFIGAVLLAKTDSSSFADMVPYLVLTAVLLFIFQPFLHRHLAGNLQKHRTAPIVAVGLALLPMSIYGGYFGAGFGFLMLAFLSFTRLKDIHQINGLKNLASASITIVCTIYFSFAGLIDWQYAPLMVTGSIAGGYLGAHWAQRLKPGLVHAFIIVLGLVVSVLLFIKS